LTDKSLEFGVPKVPGVKRQKKGTYTEEHTEPQKNLKLIKTPYSKRDVKYQNIEY